MPGSGKKRREEKAWRGSGGGAGELDGDAFFRQSQTSEKWMSRSDMEISRKSTRQYSIEIQDILEYH